MSKFFNARTALAGFAAAAALNAGAQADQVFADDVIVDGSLCVGLDCVNNEIFGFDTIRLKENNTRIAFDDTSTSGSFPNVDWELQANESTNGGANRFAFIDRTYGRTIFVMEAASPNNSLYIDRTGNIGMGTSTPVLPLHVVDGNSPALRLEQDGSSGFTAQTWDVAGNEANFFIRDATNGSRIPFKIVPGAPTNALYVAANGNVGLGTASPSAPMHLRRTDGTVQVFVEEASPTEQARILARLKNSGTTILQLTETSGGSEFSWNIQNRSAAENNDFRIVNAAGLGEEFVLTRDGNLTITGDLTTGGSGACAAGCDRVFSDSYNILPLQEHNALMWANGHLPNVGPTIEDAPFNVSVKVGRMLNELEHAHIYIGQLDERLVALEARLAE